MQDLTADQIKEIVLHTTGEPHITDEDNLEDFVELIKSMELKKHFQVGDI